VETVTEIPSAKDSLGVPRYQFGQNRPLARRTLALRRRLLHFFRLGLAVLASLFAVAPSSPGQQSKPSEYAVKATYLYNFAKFVEWPAAAAKEDSFAICVLGQDPFGQALDATLAGEAIEGKPVVARRISNPVDSVNCRILFISASEAIRLKEILAAIDKSAALTVSDMPEFSRRGGMIQFVLDGSRVRFEVNLSTARDAGLTLSSELLKVAVEVRRNIHT
jgi:hypothetical protein